MFWLMLLSLVSLISLVFKFVVHYDYHTFLPYTMPFDSVSSCSLVG